MIADLCLVLLLDASGSVDAAEWELQAKATADALSHPAIVEQITSGPSGRIAVTAMEWSVAAVTILSWTQIASMGDARSVALALATYQRRQSGSTALGDALMAAAASIKAAPVHCARSVVDLSSDGTNNAGSDPGAAVAFLRQMDVQVNAIVIQDEIGVLEFYEKTVSGFVLPAAWDSYQQAIKNKLSLEISGYPIAPVRHAGLDRAFGSGGIAYRPFDLGWPSAPDAPLPFYPELRTSESVTPTGVPGPGGALLLGLGLLGLLAWRTWR